MAYALLIFSPNKSLGASVAKGLPGFNVHTTADFADAIQFVRKNHPTPAILLDSALEEIEISVLEVGAALAQVKKDAVFILLGQVNNAPKLPLKAILQKPLVLTELQKLLNPAAQPMITVPQPALLTDGQLEWLKDVSRAARHLTRLMLESSAQAALITRDNDLWAYAGQLSRDAAQELAHSIQKYWDSQTQADILRFIRLQATDAQHMLYARRLTQSMVLALVFDAETPFSTIRAQAGQLVRSLSEVSPEATGQFTIVTQQLTTDPTEDDEEEEADDLPLFSELLGDVPPPIPPKTDTGRFSTTGWEPKRPGNSLPEALRSPFISDFVPEPQQPLAATHPLFAPDFSRESPAVQLDEKEPPTSSLEETRLSSSSRAGQNTTSDPQSIIETRPQSVTEVAHRIMLEPASAAMYNLYYACLLIPRFDTHLLTGDVNEKLSVWIPQVCVAFGWRLEHMAVRPEYLQWVVSVPPATAPGYIMRIIRQQTSDRIFSEFPRYKAENPSGDFWAPGYLIMGGSQPHPHKLVRDFIQQTRQRQGINRE